MNMKKHLHTLLPASTRPLLLMTAIVTALSGCGGDADKTASTGSVSQHIERAENYRQQHQYRAAIIEAQNARQQAPDNAGALLQFATILLDLGQGRDAAALLEPLADSGDPRITQALAQAYLQQNKFESTLRLIDATTSTGRDSDPRLLRLRGEALLGLRRHDEAAQVLRKAEAFPQEALAAQLAQVRLDVMKGNAAEARQRVQQLLAANPESIPALTLAATLAEQDNELERAEELLTRAMMQLPDADLMTPEKSQVLRSLSSILTRLGRTTEAMIYSKTLRNANPAGAELQEKFDRAFELFRNDKLDEAEPLLTEVYDKSRNELAGMLLGLIRYAHKDLAGAAEYLGSSVDPEVAPDEVLVTLASAQLQLNQPAKLLELVDPKEKGRLENPSLKALVGIALAQTGESARGGKLLEEAHRQAPDSRPVTALLARYYLIDRRPQQAIDLLTASLKQGEDHTLWQLLVSAYLAAGQHDQAIAAARKMADANPDKAESQLEFGRIAMAGKRLDLARPALQRALQLEPTLTAAKLHLAQIDLMQRNVEQAAATYRELVAADGNSIAALKGLISADELNNGKPAPGDRSLESRILATSDTPTARAVLVEYYLRNQRLDDAERVLPSTTGAPTAYLQNVRQLHTSVVASTALAARDYDKARAALLAGLAGTPDDRQLTALLATTEIRAGQFKEAEKIIAQLEGNHGTTPVVVELKGDLEAANDQPSKAAEHYQQLWRQRQNDQIAAKLYGQLQRTNAAAAAAFVGEWQRRLPQSQQPLLLEAMQLQSDGKGTQAIASYEKLLQRNPGNVIAMNNLAILYGPGDKRALPLAQQATRLAPESAAVLDTYGWLLLQSGDAEGAVEVLEKAVRLAPDAAEIADHLKQAKAKR